jgi:hypothetical protein
VPKVKVPKARKVKKLKLPKVKVKRLLEDRKWVHFGTIIGNLKMKMCSSRTTC